MVDSISPNQEVILNVRMISIIRIRNSIAFDNGGSLFGTIVWKGSKLVTQKYTLRNVINMQSYYEVFSIKDDAWILDNLHLLFLIILFIISIILFVKKSYISIAEC